MGRCKLKIEQIRDSKKRATCFRKRAQGILKKVEELSILCNCQLALVIVSEHKNVLSFSTGEIDSIIDEAKQIHSMSQMYHHQVPVIASECQPEHESSFLPPYYDRLALKDAVVNTVPSAIPYPFSSL